MSAGRTTVALLLLVALTACDPATPSPAAHSDRWWSTDLAEIPAGTARDGDPTATALAQQWSHYGQGQEEQYGNPDVVPAGEDGIPDPPVGGPSTIRLAHPPDDPATERKLYKSFSAKNWPGGAEPFSQDDGSPADVSGRYVVYQYVSSDHLQLTDSGWLNLLQLKEGYSADGGIQTSDPSWWLVLYQRQGQLFLDLAHWKEGEITGPRRDFEPLLDRWVKYEMRVHQDDRIEIWINDELFDTGTQATYPVGRMRFTGQPLDGDGPAITREEGWIFGAGNYSNPDDPASGSLVHVGQASVEPLS